MRTLGIKKNTVIAFILMLSSLILFVSCSSDEDNEGGKSAFDGVYVYVDGSGENVEINGNRLTTQIKYYGNEINVVYEFKIDETGSVSMEASEKGIQSISLTLLEFVYSGEDDKVKDQVEELNNKKNNGILEYYNRTETYMPVSGGFYLGGKLLLKDSVYADIKAANSSSQSADGQYLSSEISRYKSNYYYMLEFRGSYVTVYYVNGIKASCTYGFEGAYILFKPYKIEYAGADEEIKALVNKASADIYNNLESGFEMELYFADKDGKLIIGTSNYTKIN